MGDPGAPLHPSRNKGTAYTESERDALGLHGILPVAVETIDGQAVRAYAAYGEFEGPLERHIFLRDLQDTNERLFYRLPPAPPREHRPPAPPPPPRGRRSR